MWSLQETADFCSTPDFERAYDIHGKFYEGKEVTEQEQEFYDKFIRGLLDTEDLPFSVRLWLIYATKYVSGEED